MSTYTPFTLRDVQQVLRSEQGWVHVNEQPDNDLLNTKEHVFDWPIPDCPGLRLRVFTSVLVSTGETRDCGADAIRVCVPMRLKSKRVYRTAGWQQRLRDRTAEVLSTIREMEAAKHEAVAEAKASAPSNLHAIEPMLTAAGEHLKYPKIRFSLDEGTLQLHVAGPKSKYHGQVMVTDGGPYGDSVYFGRIEGGTFLASKKSPEWVLRFLLAFNHDPAGLAAEYGKKSGRCVFCRKELTHPSSLAVGYGATCAGHYNLPWGNKASA